MGHDKWTQKTKQEIQDNLNIKTMRMTKHFPVNTREIQESAQIEIKRKLFLVVKCQLTNEEEVIGLENHHLATTNPP